MNYLEKTSKNELGFRIWWLELFIVLVHISLLIGAIRHQYPVVIIIIASIALGLWVFNWISDTISWITYIPRKE